MQVQRQVISRVEYQLTLTDEEVRLLRLVLSNVSGQDIEKWGAEEHGFKTDDLPASHALYSMYDDLDEIFEDAVMREASEAAHEQDWGDSDSSSSEPEPATQRGGVGCQCRMCLGDF